MANNYQLKEQGSLTVIIVVALVMIFALAALAIDYGRMQGVYAKMRTAADAGALAGVSRIFIDSGGTLVVNTSARQVVKQVVVSNGIPLDEGKSEVQVLDSDILFGKWDFTNNRFAAVVDPTASPPAAQIDTCQVTVRKNQEINGRATHFFSSSRNEIITVSRAYIGYASKLPAGSAFPLVVNEGFLEDIRYGKDNIIELTTNSDNDDNCGYSTLRENPGQARDIKEYVEYLNTNGTGGTAPPEVDIGDGVWLSNGDHANVYNYLQNAQASWPDHEFAVTVAVIRGETGSQKFTHTQQVVDFASFVITEVIAPGQGSGHGNQGQGQSHPHRYRGYFRQAKVKSGEIPGQLAGTYGLRTVNAVLIP